MYKRQAEVRAEVRGKEQSSYRVTAVVDEEYGTVSSSNCTCEAFYNYEGMCKHCVAALLAYVNRRQAKDILAAKRTGHEAGEMCIRDRITGEILLGFVVLMYGMSAMSGAVEPLADVPEFTNLLTMFKNPVPVSYTHLDVYKRQHFTFPF